MPELKLSESERLLARAKTTTPGGVHSNVRLGGKPTPLFFARAAGSHLWDVDGNEYIDFVLGQGPMFLGHAHPAVIEAVGRALLSGQLYGGQHASEIDLAELFCQVIPCAEQVRFSSSGTEAVQAALRVARAATGRKRVIKFEGHYHGWIDNIYLNLSPSKLQDRGVLVPETSGQVAPAPEYLTVLPWNDANAVISELARGDVAAVIMEPIAANQAVILPEAQYLETVRDHCTRNGTVLIFDEVITGFRVGVSGAQGLFGVTPDLAVFGKAMASGFPISCLAGRSDLFEGVAAGTVTHAGTFNGNVACVAASLATVQTLAANPDFYELAKGLGQRFLSGVAALGRHDIVVQGLPEVFWIGFGTGHVRNARDLRDFGESNLIGFDASKTATVSGALVAQGVYATTRGTWYVSCVHTEADIDAAVEALGGVLNEIV